MKVYTLVKIMGLLLAASILTACGTAKVIPATEAVKQSQVQRTVLEVDTVNIKLDNVFTDADGTFTYSIESNSNASVVTPSISGNNLNFVFNNFGTSVITFKETDATGSRLASLTVSVMEGVLSQPADVRLTVGSNFLADTIAGFSYGNLQNSNPSVVAVNISGSFMTLDFLGEGTSTISFDETGPDGVVRPAGFTIEGVSCNSPVVTAEASSDLTTRTTLPSVCSPIIDFR